MSNPEIQDTDYNGIRSKVEKILGNFSGTFGYGQTLVSTAVFEGETITRQQLHIRTADSLTATYRVGSERARFADYSAENVRLANTRSGQHLKSLLR